MKFLLYFLLLSCMGSNFTLGIASADEKWYVYFIEQFKAILKNGYPPSGIPKLDPYDVNGTYCFKNRLNTVNLHLNGFVSNFSDFYVNNLEIKPDLHSTLELQFTAINFIAQYNLNGQLIKAIPLAGNGDIKLFVGNFVLLTEFMIHGNNRTIKISDFKFNYDIGVSRIAISGLLEKYHLNNIIEHFLGDIVPSGLKLLRNNVQKLIDNMTPELANDWLKGMDPKHIIEAIKSLLVPSVNLSITSAKVL